ncbi:MAG: hypothetical protein GOP50_10555 [Candidatus Heimdallarchaeota archaeon]|nr:hypothetical protein [Candidatus Heimdallarchaeota archaeon]
MKKDPMIIGVASVLVIAFTLSLLNIYVFPDIFFNVNVYRNTDNEFKMGLLQIAEEVDFDSDIFAGINFTSIIVESPENAIIDISRMIELAQEKKSAAFDNQEEIMPRRIKLKYNGTIVGVGNDSLPYEDWIENVFDDGGLGTYLAFKNPASNFEVYSNFTIQDVDSYTIEDAINALQDIFTNPSILPDYVIYQSVEYTESRGLFNEYSTEFERIIFIDTFGEIVFFLTTEGDWTTPLLY